MQDDMVGDMLAKRRDRAIATILRVKESECDKFLPGEARRLMRKAVLDELNDFCEMALDLMSSYDSGAVMNELWLQKINELHSHFLGGHAVR